MNIRLINERLNWIFSILGHQRTVGLSIVLACWIKFNIVLFTYNTYTGTKIFFPIFLLILIGVTVRKWNRILTFNPSLWCLMLTGFSFLLPIGYLTNPYHWDIYRQKALSLISYLAIYYGVFYLTKHQRKRLFFFAYVFCLISLAYVVLQVYFKISYTNGHMRSTFPGDRPFGILDDPNYSSGLLLIGFFYCMGLVFYSRKFLLVLPILFGFLLGLHKFHSFGALLGLVGGLAFMIIGVIPTIFLGNRIKGVFLVFLAGWLSIFFSMILFHWLHTSDFMQMQTLLSAKEASIWQRVKLIDWAVAIFLENWVFGVGLANDFNPEIHVLYSSHSLGIVRNLCIHTTMLSAFATNGIFGGGALVLLTSCTIFRFSYLFANQVNRSRKVFIFCMFSSFITIQILSYSLQMLYSIPYWFSLILPFLLDFTLPEDEKTEENHPIY